MIRFREENGIASETVPPDTPDQNGVAERRIGIVKETAQLMLHRAQLSSAFWADAVHTATHILNRCYSSSIGCTPYETYNKKKPNMSHIRTFRSLVYSTLSRENYQSFEPRAHVGILLGFGHDDRTKG
jgi:hypothetical protein